MKSFQNTEFVDPLRWFPIATDRIARLSRTVDRDLKGALVRSGGTEECV